MNNEVLKMTKSALNRLDGKVSLVTGAGKGMGAATARVFAGYGARVIVSDVDIEAGLTTVEDIVASGGEAHFVRCDVSDEEQVSELVAATVVKFGRLDCAVNNAAIIPDSAPIADADMQIWDKVIRIDLRGVMVCMKYEIRQFLAQGSGGAIVNVGSVSSVRPQMKTSAYVAAKHGVIGLTKTGSLEYAGRGIRVNAVLPGAIETPMLKESLERNGRDPSDVSAALSLLGRLGKPEEVAEASAWLCSDSASYVTGHSLAVEAGYLSR